MSWLAASADETQRMFIEFRRSRLHVLDDGLAEL